HLHISATRPIHTFHVVNPQRNFMTHRSFRLPQEARIAQTDFSVSKRREIAITPHAWATARRPPLGRRRSSAAVFCFSEAPCPQEAQPRPALPTGAAGCGSIADSPSVR